MHYPGAPTLAPARARWLLGRIRENDRGVCALRSIVVIQRRRFLLPVLAATLLACARIANLESADRSGAGPAASASGETGTSLQITPPEIKLADVVCNSAGRVGASLTLANTSVNAIPYAVEIPAGDRFILRGADNIDATLVRGVAAAGASAKIDVVLVSTKTPGEFGTDILVTEENEAVQKVHVTATITGASLTFTPSLIDFGEVRRDTAIPNETTQVENTGNDPVLIKSFTGTGSPELAVEGANFPLQPGEKRDLAVTFAAGPATAEQTAEIVPVTDRPLCGDAPKITLKGTRVNQDVLVNPATVDFGEVSCLDDPARSTRSLTISNYAPLAKSFTVTLPVGDSSAYVADPVSGFVSGLGGQTTIVLHRKPGLALGNHPESILISVAGMLPKTASIDVSIVGALLEITPETLTGLDSNSKTFSVKNVGNRSITVKHRSSSDVFTVTSSSTLNAGETETPLVTLKTSESGTYETRITTTRDRGADLCAPPAVVTASGSK
jgi:hypothetical protein